MNEAVKAAIASKKSLDLGINTNFGKMKIVSEPFSASVEHFSILKYILAMCNLKFCE